MDKKYLAKIIAKDSQGLKLISAYCFEAKVKINELKYLKKNQIYCIFLGIGIFETLFKDNSFLLKSDRIPKIEKKLIAS